MRTSNKPLVSRDIEQLFRHGIAASRDASPVDPRTANRGELAFEALVARHGPMVRGVCRRLLLTLMMRMTPSRRHSLSWLARPIRFAIPTGSVHGSMAWRRVATKARNRAARYRHEPPVEVYDREPSRVEWLDVMPIVDAELRRLPAKHREVLTLCLINGATAEEAAAQLGCPVGTVKSRLARPGRPA